MMKRFTGFMRNFRALLLPYWSSEERWRARALLAIIIGMNLGLVYINVLLNAWNNRFYNAIQDKDYPVFLHELLIFCGLAGLYIVIAVYQLYLNQMLQIRWRRWLTEHYIADWLRDRVYYRLQLTEYGTDNPDQRIAEDLRIFIGDTLSLGFDLLRQVVTLVSFVGILWALSGPLAFTLGGIEIVIPAYMVWVAVAYSLFGSWITHKIGNPLIRLNFQQQRYEADFRFGLVRFRENAEGIALYRGESGEERSFREQFEAILRNWWAIMRKQKQLTFFTVGFNQVALVFPLVVAAPRYFEGVIELGGLMQIASAFGQVQDALSWFVNAYVGTRGQGGLTEWKATVDRLTGFREAIERARAEARETARIAVTPGPDNALAIDELDITLPDGRMLLTAHGVRIAKGEKVLVTGPSGAGKSTLFRAIAGIWPFGSGRIAVPAEARVLFLPQRPYLPIDTLRAAVSYPALPGAFDDAAIGEALRAVKLEPLAADLDRHERWAQRLSPGEQQRLAVARALLHRPDWLFLDEATAAVDADTETHLHELLRRRLPDTTIVSITHRPTAAEAHDRRIAIKADASGIGRLADVPTVSGRVRPAEAGE